jgi:hypothetical protein
VVSGLAEALRQLKLSHHNVVGVGDAENDHAFLQACGCAAAVANALPTVKQAADIELSGAQGAGVIELMELICSEDARIMPAERNVILLGTECGREIYLRTNDKSILIAGKSGFGKSTLATALTESMAEQGFEFCVFDPEGDYDQLKDAVSIGSAKAAPTEEEVLKLLGQMEANLVFNTQGLNVSERPVFFIKLLPHVAALRAKSGRPHWLLIDEAHHLLPSSRNDLAQVIPDDLSATIFITVHPEAISLTALLKVETVIALGEDAAEVISSFCQAIGIDPPSVKVQPKDDEVLVWRRNSGEQPRPVVAKRPRQARKRHTRKYADGNLGEDISFYFRGPDDALNLRAQNLMRFVEIARGIDDRTWMHHLRRGDYSDWFRRVIKNKELAEKAAAIEADENVDAGESRRRIEHEVSLRYTAPSLADDL